MGGGAGRHELEGVRPLLALGGGVVRVGVSHTGEGPIGLSVADCQLNFCLFDAFFFFGPLRTPQKRHEISVLAGAEAPSV